MGRYENKYAIYQLKHDDVMEGYRVKIQIAFKICLDIPGAVDQRRIDQHQQGHGCT